MAQALDYHHSIVSLWFSDDISGLAREKGGFTTLMNCLDRTSSRIGIEIRAEKTKLRQIVQQQWKERSQF